MKFSKMSINDLPYEMMATILGYLCPHSLERAILTCKLWKQVIEESCLWPWDVDLSVLHIGKWTKFSQITKRKFNKFSINASGCDYRDLRSLHDILKIHGSNVVQLYLSECCWTMTFFVEILKCLPKLSHLDLVRTELLYPVNNSEILELKRLKTMNIVLSFGHRHKQSLVKQNITPTITPASFHNLFRSQKHLKRLSIHSELSDFEDSAIFQAFNRDMPFQLTHLSLDNLECNIESTAYNNLLRFLEKQAATITALELRGHFSKSLYKLVLSKFKILKSIRLGIANLPRDESFYMQLEPNNSITTLILVKMTGLHYETLFHCCPRWFKEFIRCVPKVTDLSLHARFGLEATYFLSYNLKKVEKLKFEHLNMDLNVLHFPRLSSLNIEDFEVDANWIEFIGNNIQIKELTVNRIRKDVNVDIVDAIQELLDSMNSSKLDIIRIGKRIRLTPVYKSVMMKDGKFTSHWKDVEWWVDGKCFGSFANKLFNLRLTIEIWGRCYSRIVRGKNVIDLEREILRQSYDQTVDRFL